MSGNQEMRERLVMPLALVILVGWVAALGYAMIEQQYQPLTVTTPLMLIITGYATGINITRRTNGER